MILPFSGPYELTGDIVTTESAEGLVTVRLPVNGRTVEIVHRVEASGVENEWVIPRHSRDARVTLGAVVRMDRHLKLEQATSDAAAAVPGC